METSTDDRRFMAQLIRFFCFFGATIAAIILLVYPLAEAAETSGLPLPRFVSLRSDEVNLRSGPGVRYPVDWIYSRRDLPVEVIAEFEAWRKIRDWQGTEGWVHQSMLSSRRMLVVTGSQRKLRAEPDEKAPALALVDPSVVGRLIGCPHAMTYCRVDIGNVEGWLRREEFWGVYPGEYMD
jgi:SH3-like domain-containing protein